MPVVEEMKFSTPLAIQTSRLELRQFQENDQSRRALVSRGLA